MKLNIDAVVRAILNKRKPQILAVLDKPKKKGLILMGKPVQAKPQAVKPKKVDPWPKPKPKPVQAGLKKVKHPDLKLVAMSEADKFKIEGLIKKEPLRALALSNSIHATIRKKNAKIKAYNNLNELERERKAEREAAIKSAFEKITASLPRPSEVGLDPNFNAKVLVSIISKAGFQSALENDVLFLADVNQNLSVKVGAVTYKIQLDDHSLIEALITKLLTWSKMGKALDNVTAWDIVRGLGAAASLYQIQQAKKKSSDYYLGLLVAEATKAEISVKRDALLHEYLNAFSLEVATQAAKIGFKTDRNKAAVLIDASENKFGMVEISEKDMLTIMGRIIKGSTISGKLTGANKPNELLIGVLNYLPL